MAEATGLQQAENVFQSMLSDTPIEKQQQLEEVTEEAEIEAEDPEIEAEAEVETEEDQPEEEEEQPDKYYRVKRDGVEYEVTLDEALAGWQRQQDYTKKTQVVAEEKKALQAEHEAAKNERLQYQQRVEHLVQQQESQKPVEPDWDQLYEADPLQWMKQKEEFRTNKEKSLELQQEQFRLQQEQQQEQQAQMQQFITQQHDVLIDAIPEWKDPQVMAREKNEIKQYAQSIGYRPEEVNQIYDSRAVLALRTGMKASGLSGKGAAKLRPIKEAIRSVTPGSAAQQPRQHTTVSKAKMKLAKTGKMSDAENIFKHLL